MSSKYVRAQIKNHIQTNISTETIVDFSAMYLNVSEIRDTHGLGFKDPFLGIQYLPSDESPVSVISNNATGCYREFGAILLHIVESVNPTMVENILDRGEALLESFRGATINGDIYIESVSYPNFDSSVTANFENGYESATIVVNFYRNYNF